MSNNIKKPNIEVIISVVSAIICISLFTTLLFLTKIGPPIYLALLTLLAFVCIILPLYQRLRVLDLKNLKFELNKFETVKKEVFAKEEYLKKISALLSDIIAVNSALQGYMGSEESHKIREEWTKIKLSELSNLINLPDAAYKVNLDWNQRLEMMKNDIQKSMGKT